MPLSRTILLSLWVWWCVSWSKRGISFHQYMKIRIFTKPGRWKCSSSLIHELLTCRHFLQASLAYPHKIEFFVVSHLDLIMYDLHVVRVKMKIEMENRSHRSVTHFATHDMTYSRLAWTFCIVCQTHPMCRTVLGLLSLFLFIDPVLSRLITYIRIMLSDGRTWWRKIRRVWMKIPLFYCVLFTRPTIHCHWTVNGDYNDGPKTSMSTTTTITLQAFIPTLNRTVYCRTLYVALSDRSRCSKLLLHYFILC